MILYDPTENEIIKNSKNAKIIAEKGVKIEPKMLGYVVFNKTYSRESQGIFLKRVVAKKSNPFIKKKLILAMRRV